ncbi:MASE3 domain-containing protein [Kordiimonas lipolytica]|uniref:MASE3 domain-containing protein n=1 Tax=Kordiimonas lipolytica TaxID=1662421 RepID=A0ABV8U7Q3_9PROT|nr:MASE3 domain-containing protein [Kordiimonas lipolytica]
MLSWADFYTNLRHTKLWLPPVVAGIILILIAQHDYLTFHTVAELGAIFVALAICVLSWETQWVERNRFLALLAAGYFWVAFLDTNHAFTFEGMNLYLTGSVNLSVQFWLLARFLETLILIVTPHLIGSSVRSKRLFFGYGAIAALGTALILLGIFPTGYIDGQGLTAFKVNAEYIIIAGLIFASAQLHLASFRIPKEEEVLLGTAIFMTIAAELAFTLYEGPDDTANLLGHVFKIFSFWLIFRAVVIPNLQKPYFQLDRQRKRANELFDNAEISLWDEDLSAVQAELKRLRESGVRDLRCYLRKNPEKITELAGMVRVLRVNRATLQMFEAEDQRQFISRVDKAFGPNAMDVFVDELAAIWKKKPYFRGQVDYVTAKGKALTCLISFRIPRRDAAFASVPVSIIDITEKQALQHQVENFFDTPMHMNVIASTVDGTILKVNAAAQRILGYAPKELEGKTFLELVHPDDIEKTLAEMDSLNEKGATLSFENRYRRKTGEYRLISWSSVARNEVAYAIATDVTERKHAEVINTQLASIRNTIMRCQAIMMKSQEPSAMLQDVARELVSALGYRLVWFAKPQDSATASPLEITTYASENNSIGEKDLTRLAAARTSPAQTALKSGTKVFTNSHSDDLYYRQWQELAGSLDLEKTVSLPIMEGGNPVATMTIHANRDTFPNPQEIDLMQELATNIALALKAGRMTREIVSAHEALGNAALGAINALATTLEKRDPYTSGHQGRVAQLAEAIGRKLGWNEFKLEGMRLGATVHDIGKIYVPAEILNRPGKLTSAEFGIIKSHPEVGHDILKDVAFPWPIADMVVQHHERIDGTGYPKGLKGDEIIPEAQVIAVADVVEAITAHRPYRPALGIEEGLKELRRGRGTAYAPEVVDACIEVIEEDHFNWS